MDRSWPGSSVHGPLQERLLEGAAIFSSRGSSLTQGLNPCFLHLLYWQEDSLPLHYLLSLGETVLENDFSLPLEAICVFTKAYKVEK